MSKEGLMKAKKMSKEDLMETMNANTRQRIADRHHEEEQRGADGSQKVDKHVSLSSLIRTER